MTLLIWPLSLALPASEVPSQGPASQASWRNGNRLFATTHQHPPHIAGEHLATSTPCVSAGVASTISRRSLLFSHLNGRHDTSTPCRTYLGADYCELLPRQTAPEEIFSRATTVRSTLNNGSLLLQQRTASWPGIVVMSLERSAESGGPRETWPGSPPNDAGAIGLQHAAQSKIHLLTGPQLDLTRMRPHH